MPFPFSFVVKNGSKRWAITSASMPTPLSRTDIRTWVPGARVEVQPRLLGVDLDDVGANHDCPRPRHRVLGVHDEVREHLLDLPRVDADRRQRLVEPGAQPDALADQPAQHPVHVA